MDAFIGEIRAFAFGFVPEGWLACNGALLNGGQYQALYALLGNLYGGDPNNSTFRVPNLQGFVAQGSVTLQQSYRIPGATGGTVQETLTELTIPPHTHSLNTAVATKGGQLVQAVDTPSATVYPFQAAISTAAAAFAYATTPDGTTLASNSLNALWGPVAQPHSNMGPYLPMQYCICEQGTWPPKP